jgi:hypothetical protein
MRPRDVDDDLDGLFGPDDAAGDEPPWDPQDPAADPFHPPSVPTLVHCIHCHEEYDSYLMQYRVEEFGGKELGSWCCPMPGCDGRGFGFDIWPVEPDFIDPDGREMSGFDDDDEIDDEDSSYEADLAAWNGLHGDWLLDLDIESDDEPPPSFELTLFTGDGPRF